METITEIRWHARGGQGAKTAATFLADVALSEGKYAQGFPEYGPERMGAPMQGYTRVSDAPIKLHCGIYEPDIVIVLDQTLFETENLLEGLPEDGMLLINTHLDPAGIRSKFNIEGGSVYTLDATKISIEEMKRDIPNTPMMGALAKASGFPSMVNLVKDMEELFSRKFTDEVVKANIRAVKRAYQEVKGE